MKFEDTDSPPPSPEKEYRTYNQSPVAATVPAGSHVRHWYYGLYRS